MLMRYLLKRKEYRGGFFVGGDGWEGGNPN